jgi:hypothetical protein
MLSTIYALHDLHDLIADAEFLADEASPEAANLLQVVEDVASLIARRGRAMRPAYHVPGGAELPSPKPRRDYHAGRAFDLAHRGSVGPGVSAGSPRRCCHGRHLNRGVVAY